MDNTIKTGILSYGMSGQLFHSPFVDAHEGYELTAVVERSQKRAHLKYPDIKSYDSVDLLMADDQIELVIVNTPNTTHFEFALKALQMGKHVLVEKPFTVTPAEAEKLFVVARENDRRVLPYQNRRFDSDFLSVKKVLDSGKLGRLVEVHFRFDRYKYEIGKKAAKETAVAGSGLLFDLGPHLLDQAISLFGMPLRWTKTLGHFRPGTQVDDYAHLHLSYPGELQVFITVSLLVADAQPAFVLHGTKGSFIKNRTDVQEDQLLENRSPKDPLYGLEKENQQGILTTMAEDGTKRVERIAASKSTYLNMFDAVYRTIRESEPYPIAEEEVLKQLEILK
ncbi:Gfo/Idh/MocA family oxidoreductase [Flavobacteriaceae bacterium F89]|uniref:Gfo/Idh/MocA family oxidoreductase n=1 Tax=Cerina litoralis TaxID=2874477 RepID=A0AAE3EXA2_9FLAO|nr:Gfo/Idh/MocA family oxidoreductase [Cerina litoralis]MCG2461441.1 Gfo/Idh/MocA family oxidoreductase [Cerina litoralis]